MILLHCASKVTAFDQRVRAGSGFIILLTVDFIKSHFQTCPGSKALTCSVEQTWLAVHFLLSYFMKYHHQLLLSSPFYNADALWFLQCQRVTSGMYHGVIVSQWKQSND